MNLSRRGFLGALGVTLLASKLPIVRAVRPRIAVAEGVTHFLKCGTCTRVLPDGRIEVSMSHVELPIEMHPHWNPGWRGEP